MKFCSRCMLPETHETIEFDDEGACNICRQHEFKKSHVDWDAKYKELKRSSISIAARAPTTASCPSPAARTASTLCGGWCTPSSCDRWW